jgi:hypothetical protein
MCEKNQKKKAEPPQNELSCSKLRMLEEHNEKTKRISQEIIL